MERIPVYEPTVSSDDVAAVSRAVGEGQLSGTSPVIERLEVAYAHHCQMPYAVAVANGTAALELAVAALDLGPGDEVLCPASAIISCARAIVLAGATPVLVDVDPGTWCIDADALESRVTSRTRAILGVHAFGHPYDHVALLSSAKRHGLSIIEDAAQAHGAGVRTPDGTRLPCGGLGDVSTFSFYANKAVTMGEGGMVLTRSRDVATRVRDSANLFMRGPRRFLHDELGHNYRLSSIQAALGLSQLARLEDTIARKRRIAAFYREKLARFDEIELQQASEGSEPIFWMNALVLSEKVPGDAAALAELLARGGVETRPFFVGLHEQPALHARGLFEGEHYPVSERLSRRGLYLPSGLGLDESVQERVVSQVEAAIGELRSRPVFVPADNPTTHLDDSPSETVFGATFAECYDALYEKKDYAGEVDLLVRRFERFSERPVRRVADLGCGTGRHVEELVRRGYEVTGVDRSAPMLSLARERVSGARFVEGDLRTVELGETFDAVVILFAALCYQTTPESIAAALRNARRHLRDGGLLLADVWFGGATPGRDVVTRRAAHTPGVEWLRTGRFHRDPLAQRVDVIYELTRRSSAGESVTREVHSMHYFSPFELSFALRASGFSLVTMSREDSLDKSPSWNDLTAFFVAEASPIS